MPFPLEGHCEDWVLVRIQWVRSCKRLRTVTGPMTRVFVTWTAQMGLSESLGSGKYSFSWGHKNLGPFFSFFQPQPRAWWDRNWKWEIKAPWSVLTWARPTTHTQPFTAYSRSHTWPLASNAPSQQFLSSGNCSFLGKSDLWVQPLAWWLKEAGSHMADPMVWVPDPAPWETQGVCLYAPNPQRQEKWRRDYTPHSGCFLPLPLSFLGESMHPLAI